MFLIKILVRAEKNMKNKIIVIFVCMLLLTATLVIISVDLKVEATSGEKDNRIINLDYQYIYNISENLSNIIFNAYEPGDLEKGREFGSKGEHYAASYIADNMSFLRLYNPGLDPPYLEKIQSINTSYMKDAPRRDDIRSKLEIQKQNITIHNQTSNTTQNIECHIRPAWELTGLTAGTKWSWPLLSIIYNTDDTSALTQNFSCNNLKLYHEDDAVWLDQVIEKFNATIIENAANWTPVTLFEFLIEKLQDFWSFNLDELNESNAPVQLKWYNSTYTDAPFFEDFLYIGENQAFNPNASKPKWGEDLEELFEKCCPRFYHHEFLLFNNITCEDAINYLYDMREFIKSMIWRIIHPRCKGVIYYDFNDNTYDMNLRAYIAIPTLYINGSIGNSIEDDIEVYRVDYELQQRWNNTVDSYNVIGQINGTNPNSNKTVIIGCIYDSWWTQGTADSAIGMAMVLGIAKYMKQLETDYDIKPKYNTKFIGFSGEEYLARGAYYHEAANPPDQEDVVTFIDLNQLGFSQPTGDPRLTLYIYSNNDTINSTMNIIGEDSCYIERTGDTADFQTQTKDKSHLGNYHPYTKNLSYYNRTCNTIYLVKDTNWTLHHRDGEMHTKGDVMDYYFSDDVNVTTEIIWNITKYFTINPDCWISNITYEAFDTVNDGDSLNDSIKITYTLNTIIPQDRIMVEYTILKHIGLSMTEYSKTTENHTITSNGLQKTYTFNIPENENNGVFSINIKIYNSTARINKIIGIEPDDYNQTNTSDEYALFHCLGYANQGSITQNAKDRITGVVFTANENATANNITVFLQADLSIPPPKGKCMIFRNNDSALIGVTEEIIVSTSAEPEWKTFNFYQDPQPQLIKGVEYILSVWTDKTCSIYYDTSQYYKGRYNETTYGSIPTNTIFTNENKLYSIYCAYNPN